MAWTSLSERFATLPDLLAGPILRRCESTNVSVWFVLKKDWKATLLIYDKTDSNPLFSGEMVKGIGIGDHVFVYCITAKPLPNKANLSDGRNYFYDIKFEGEGIDSLSEMIVRGLELTYNRDIMPSFSLPPNDINNVRLIHGSCRKPHGEGYDAMEGVHEMILSAIETNPNSGETKINSLTRPHQLFLTGDQIYADDVADVMLYMIDDASKTLFGWDEKIYDDFTWGNEHQFKPNLNAGKRNENEFIQNQIGFTGMIKEKPVNSKSHLLKFKEYSSMYLFAWSDVLWPASTIIPNTKDNIDWTDEINFPLFSKIFPHEEHRINSPTKKQKDFSNETENLWNFTKTLKNIRKAIANVPTYMIFDDHEITDDWNINWKWCQKVYSQELGQRTVLNGLLAYSIFQAWGNDPKQFEESDKKILFDKIKQWKGLDDENFQTIKRLLNIPRIKSEAIISDFPHPPPPSKFFDWHFSIEASNYVVYVQDSRTWRGYEKNSNFFFANLISQEGYQRQLPPTFPINKETKLAKTILIIAPCPVLGEPSLEKIQRNKASWQDRYDKDTEAWALNKEGFERLFSNLVIRLPVNGEGALRKRTGKILFLSGDVHYGLSSRCQIWGNNFLMDSNSGVKTDVVFAQLIASSFKNMTFGTTGTMQLHSKGYVKESGVGEIAVVSNNALESSQLPKPVQNYVWLIPPGGKSIGISYPVADRGELPINPEGILVKSIQELSFDKTGVILLMPNWRYRIDWILGESPATDPRLMKKPRRIEVSPNPNLRTDSINSYLEMTKGHASYVKTWGTGKEIVGENTLGEIRFNFRDTTNFVNHILWWRMDPITGEDPLQIFPLTNFSIFLNFNGDKTYEGLDITIPEFNPRN